MTMPAITSAVAGTTITASAWNTAFTTIRNHYNTYAAENVGTQTIAGAKTFSAAAVFSLGLTATTGGITVSAGGLTVTGNSTITGTLGSLTGITSTGTASFANVTASGTLGVTGTSTLGTVGAGALTCTSLTVNGGSGTVSITGPTSASDERQYQRAGDVRHCLSRVHVGARDERDGRVPLRADVRGDANGRGAKRRDRAGHVE